MEARLAAAFLRKYFPKIFHDEFSPQQLKFICDLLRHVSDQLGPGFYYSMPRGHGTTSIKCGLNIYLTCMGEKAAFHVELDHVFMLLESLSIEAWDELVTDYPCLAIAPPDDLAPL